MNSISYTKQPPSRFAAAIGKNLLQRQCACGGSPGVSAACAECGEKQLQRQPAGSIHSTDSMEAPPIVGEVLGSAGQPLDAATRSFFEARLGHDFGRVRIHDDARAAELARAVSAHAYTVGRDIVFARGRYEPQSDAGTRLLAHELTHVIQQSGLSQSASSLKVGPANDAFECQQQRLQRRSLAEIQPKLALSEPGDALEQEADRVAQSVLDGGEINEREIGHADRLSRKRNQRTLSPVAVPPSVNEALSASGQPLDFSTRDFFESRFDHDFSQVRIHTDRKSAESANAVQALAYTVGSDVAFGAGQYQPHTTSGRRLIAHELAHVIQQSAVTAPLRSSLLEATPQLQRQAASEGLASCSETQRASVEMIAQNAREQLVDPAISRLRRITSSAPSDEESKRVVNALSRHFHTQEENAAETASKVAQQLSSIGERLAGIRSEKIHCASDVEPLCGFALASWSRDEQILTLCPGVFSSDPIDKAPMEALVHEFAHASGLHIHDLGYASQRIYGRMTTEEALSNADSYSQLALELSGSSAQGAAPKKDAYTDCASSERAVLEDALAKAEVWNFNALNVLTVEQNFDSYASVLGGFTRFDPKAKTNAPARFNDAQFRGFAKTYEKANAVFKKRFSVRCEPPNGDFCAESASHFDGAAFTLCSRGIDKGADDYLALQILWDLYASLGSISAASEGLLARRLHQEFMARTDVDDASASGPAEDGMPSGETFIAEGWGREDDRTMALWKQQLLPDKGNFKGLEVKEEDPADQPHVNSCCDPGEVACFKKISGGIWTVEADNTYKTDTVGLIAPLVEKYQRKLKSRNQESCGYAVPQRMVVIKGNHPKEYVMNWLMYVITKDAIACGKVNKFGAQWIGKKFPE